MLPRNPQEGKDEEKKNKGIRLKGNRNQIQILDIVGYAI